LEHPNFIFVQPVPSRPKSLKEEKYLDILRDRAHARIINPYKAISYHPEMSTLPVISIDQVREMKKEVRLKSSGGVRVFLVSNADRMTTEAANSLLKLLEEPPEGTVLFLTTHRPGFLLKTILSRCQNVRFDPLTEEEIQSALEKRLEIPLERATLISRMAGGSLQTALSLAEDGFLDRRELAYRFIEASLADPVSRMDLTDEIARIGDKQSIREILQLVLMWLRDLLMLSSDGISGLSDVMNLDQKPKLESIKSRWPLFDIESAMSHVQRTIAYIEKNVYLPLALSALAHELEECRNIEGNR
jgi:DNA polymerase-3 subunit delta'